MTLTYILLAVIILLLFIILFKVLNPSDSNNNNDIGRIESSVRQEISNNRIELNQSAKTSREELSGSLKIFGDLISKSISDTTTLQKNQLETFSNNLTQVNQTIEGKLTKLTEVFEGKLTAFQETGNINSRDSRKELKEVLDTVKKELTEALSSFSDSQRNNFGDLKNDLNAQNTKTGENLKEMRGTIELNIKSLQQENSKKLDEMRATVDEKLEKTLSERLGQSFETVGKQLIEVQKGLGEMQTLAQDVGGLKKVLGNVKMRGGIGEIQLAMLLEQILAPEQYQANVKTKPGSDEIVEFAIKLPGRDDNNGQVWLPVDAKFPKDIYEQLQAAYDNGDVALIEIAQRNLDITIKKMAKDIGDKYIHPPFTTDFGIMFLPFEGIYAEVVRKASLLEDLHRNYKIIVTGPTTLAAILNSLQMGFKTLAIQKRSGEVWEVLGAVKKEFEQFGNLLQKSQNNIQTGLNQLDEVMGKRTKAIQRKLRSVESNNEIEPKIILPGLINDELLDDEQPDN